MEDFLYFLLGFFWCLKQSQIFPFTCNETSKSFLCPRVRDLKPTNVLLDENDRPLLMDLGSMNKARIEVRDIVTL